MTFRVGMVEDVLRKGLFIRVIVGKRDKIETLTMMITRTVYDHRKCTVYGQGDQSTLLGLSFLTQDQWNCEGHGSCRTVRSKSLQTSQLN